jgi:hypothetical protein
MHKKLLWGGMAVTVAAMAAWLALSKKAEAPGIDAPAALSTPASNTFPPEPTPPVETSDRAGSGQADAAATAEPAPEPIWNAANLQDTVWEAQSESGLLQVQFLAEGVLVASHPILKEYSEETILYGTWRVEGDAIITTLQMEDETQSAEVAIVGDKLYRDEVEFKRIK